LGAKRFTWVATTEDGAIGTPRTPLRGGRGPRALSLAFGLRGK